MGDEQPHRLTIAVPGVAADAPLSMALDRTLQGLAQIVPTGQLPQTSALWRRIVRKTALDWIGPTAIPASTDTGSADVLLDLHGGTTRPPGPTWRIVDGTGTCVLQPFAGLTTGVDAPLVTSLHLIEADGPGATWVCLAEAHISARRSSRHLLEAVARTIAWLVQAAIRQRPPVPPPWSPPNLEPHNGLSDLLRSRSASLRARLRDGLASEIWAIGRVTEPADKFLKSRTVEPVAWTEIPAREGFIADPFPWPGRDDVMLYERYSHRTGLGVIEATHPLGGTVDATQSLDLNIRTHLSYPFTYAAGEHVVCLPEMAAERRQVMYVLSPDHAPREFCVVAEDIAMADPTLFRRGDLFWIAYNDADLGLHENLCLLFSPRLEGPWTPHRLNPVKVDLRSSRPAGAPFCVGDALFRPAQDCSDSYGCALTMNRILVCTASDYRETTVATLRPNRNGRFPHGIHTFSVGPNVIFVDGKRFVLDWNILLQRFSKRLRRRGVRIG
jgi:hypothetical protein